MSDETIIEVRRPEFLRWTMLVIVAVMFAAAVGAAMNNAASAPFAAVMMALFAAAIGWFGQALFMTRARSVKLVAGRLVDDAGVEICRLDEVLEVEKGLHLYKPSSGFALKLKEKREPAWSPGLWWRVGTRVGVGGATPGRKAKAMADAVAAEILRVKVAEAEAEAKAASKKRR